jgi:hypothetical protein
MCCPSQGFVKLTPTTEIVMLSELPLKNFLNRLRLVMILRLGPDLSARLLDVVVDHGRPILDVALQ